MKQIYSFLICTFMLIGAKAQVKVTFELENIPTAKDSVDRFYVAGSFNSWLTNSSTYRFSKISNEKFQLQVLLPTGNYEYKVTRGNWDRVEAGIKGNFTANRILNLKRDTLIQLKIVSWGDSFPKTMPKHTASVNVKVMDSAFVIPQLNTTRKIWIYLPASYASSKKSYPVLYMHDGQNLFDEYYGGFGEWGIDETLDSLIAKGAKAYIVIGIDHGGSERMKEYNPYDSQYGKGKGSAYVDFLANNLKPFVDQHYRTKKDAENTAIAGSSMGGLISMFAITKYPDVFGKAGIFSPAFWVGKKIDSDITSALPKLKKHQVYFVSGSLEGKMMIKDMASAYQILNLDSKSPNIKMVEKADGKHSEWFWRREFVDFYKFISKY